MKRCISQYLNDSLVIFISEEDKIFAGRLLALRKQRGWSQPELAKKIGISGAIIGRYERGEITPSIRRCTETNRSASGYTGLPGRG